MKFGKRFAAIGAAMTMAVSTMCIGANAQETKSWAVHYYSYAPSSSNVYSCEKNFYYNGHNITRYKRICSTFSNGTNPDGSLPRVKYWGYVIDANNDFQGLGFNTRYFTQTENTGLFYDLTVSVGNGEHLIVKHVLDNVNADINAAGQTVVN